MAEETVTRKLGYVMKEEQRKVIVRGNDVFAVLPKSGNSLCYGRLPFFFDEFRLSSVVIV